MHSPGHAHTRARIERAPLLRSALRAAGKAWAMRRWRAGDLWVFKAAEYAAAYYPTHYGRFEAATDFYNIDYAEVGGPPHLV